MVLTLLSLLDNISLSDWEILSNRDFEGRLGFSGVFWGYRGKLPYSFSRWLPQFPKAKNPSVDGKI
jgi:hypothetical protein